MFSRKIAAGLGMLACASAMLACADEAPGPSTVSVEIAIEMVEPAAEPGSVNAQGQASGLSAQAGLLPYTSQNVDSIRVDVYETAIDSIFTTVYLEPSAGAWIGLIPSLPTGVEFDFVARAYDESNELFNGNTVRTFAPGDPYEAITIELHTFDDGETYPMPSIVAIRYRAEFTSNRDDIVTFAIRGTAGAAVDYVITNPNGSSPPFYPASGRITLAGTTGQFVSTYRPPEVEEATELTYHVTLIGAGNTRVRTIFTTQVLPPQEGTSAEIDVLFNPVINAMTATRLPGTTDVVWEANVSDDDQDTLVYQWSFEPAESFLPEPVLTKDGAGRVVTLENYTEAVYGTIQLDVTDEDGGVTTLFYTVVPEQFPLEPEDPGELTGLRSIQGGNHHTCALFNDGGVRCWGRNDSGQLGYGNTFPIGDNERPSAVANVPLPASNPAVQIATGANHTCALLESGHVRCWGQNHVGQLGLGHVQHIGDGEAITDTPGGTVTLGGVAVKLAAGWFHTCALMDTGGVRCWGYNNQGQLGYAHTNHIGDNEVVWRSGEVNVGGKVIDITAGHLHTCALLETGTVRCWGDGFHGALGYASTADIGDNETPASAGNVNVGGTVVQIAAGAYRTCAVLATGNMRCWGYGYYGELGYPGYAFTYNFIGDNEHPASVGDIATGATVTQISSGEYHTCALLSTSQVKCWGRHSEGQLGHGGSDFDTPAAAGVNLSGNSAFQLTTGGMHTCALLNTGKAWCWGYGFYGQLGYGNTSNIGSPPAGGDIQFSATP